MPSLSLKQYIAAPPEKVFDHLTDFRRAPEYVRGIKKVELLTDGPVGVGTRFKETRIMFKREATETMEVTAFERPRGYTLTCESCGCQSVSTFCLVGRGSGTDVEMNLEVKGLTLFGRIMGFLMRPMMKMCMKEIAKDLEDIKRAVEGGAEPVAVR
jgi:hypothetical protein